MNSIGVPLIFLRFFRHYIVNDNGTFFLELQLILQFFSLFQTVRGNLATEEHTINKKNSIRAPISLSGRRD